MDGWKKALVAGSFGASAVLLLKKRWPAGVLSAGVGLARRDFYRGGRKIMVVRREVGCGESDDFARIGLGLRRLIAEQQETAGEERVLRLA